MNSNNSEPRSSTSSFKSDSEKVAERRKLTFISISSFQSSETESMENLEWFSGRDHCYRQPGLTENVYHTILINGKIFFIQFHTIPYVQKNVWKLYNKYFPMKGNCIIGIFSINQKVIFVSIFIFWKKFGLCLQPNTSDTDLGYSNTKGWTVWH